MRELFKKNTKIANVAKYINCMLFASESVNTAINHAPLLNSESIGHGFHSCTKHSRDPLTLALVELSARITCCMKILKVK